MWWWRQKIKAKKQSEPLIDNRSDVSEAQTNPVTATFYENLKFTQHYCNILLKNDNDNIASKFRTIIPVFNSEPVFGITHRDYGYNDSCEWLIDPWDKRGTFNTIFEEQLSQKTTFLGNIDENIEFNGRIVIVDFDEGVVDGASEAQSKGLFDGYDLPPIDTWFYMNINANGYRSIFAWIPEPFIMLANDAIEVNCVDCIKWYE